MVWENMNREKFYALCQSMCQGDRLSAQRLSDEMGVDYYAFRDIFPESCQRGENHFFDGVWTALCEHVGSLENVSSAVENIREANSTRRVFHAKYTFAEALIVLKKGDHIAVHRPRYSHHGIYDGEGGVFEYNEGIVRHVPLENFSKGDEIFRILEKSRYEPEKVIERARSRLDEKNYHALWNNCEHFAQWCRNGKPL